MPRLSIIVPVYNVESYVGTTLTSIFNTTAALEDFEVIIINDGTKDESMRVIRPFLDFPNLTVIEQENQGLGAARMNGLSVAKGEYIWFVDSDDWLVEDGVGIVMFLLNEQPNADVMMFPLLWVYGDSMMNHIDYHIKGNRVENGRTVIRESGLPVWASPRFIIKRSLLTNRWLYFPKGVLHEDDYFGPVLMCFAKVVFVLKDPVYNYRQRDNSIMTSLTLSSSNSIVAIHRLLVHFGEEVLPSDDQEWFRQYCFVFLRQCYTRNSSIIGSRDFSRFALRHGYYVWCQWLSVYPNKTLKNKVGRLLYFMFPCIKGVNGY